MQAASDLECQLDGQPASFLTTGTVGSRLTGLQSRVDAPKLAELINDAVCDAKHRPRFQHSSRHCEEESSVNRLRKLAHLQESDQEQVPPRIV